MSKPNPQADEAEAIFNEAVRFIERDYGGVYAERDYPVLLLAYILARVFRPLAE
ncbi:hypothetical protein GGE24_003662 [Bradyrhizobium centrosematis]|nr:hypothetical protein [Bradyrhizobium centrosematis]MCS3774323.1 hypothetical protein [Bradyrhizobium centrosematis]